MGTTRVLLCLLCVTAFVAFAAAQCTTQGNTCSPGSSNCCNGTTCSRESLTSTQYYCRVCKNEGEVCEEGQAQCCEDECRRSNDSTSFTCTKVTGLNRACGVNGTGAPCARLLTCAERYVIPVRDDLYLDVSDAFDLTGTVTAFICVAVESVVTCVGQGGDCNNFQDGRSRCCPNNNPAGPSTFCRNVRGEGAAIIGTCDTCASSKDVCSRDNDCCVERGEYCANSIGLSVLKRCRQCVRGGGRCDEDRDCCNSQHRCRPSSTSGITNPKICQ